MNFFVCLAGSKSKLLRF